MGDVSGAGDGAMRTLIFVCGCCIEGGMMGTKVMGTNVQTDVSAVRTCFPEGGESGGTDGNRNASNWGIREGYTIFASESTWST